MLVCYVLSDNRTILSIKGGLFSKLLDVANPLAGKVRWAIDTHTARDLSNRHTKSNRQTIHIQRAVCDVVKSRRPEGSGGPRLQPTDTPLSPYSSPQSNRRHCHLLAVFCITVTHGMGPCVFSEIKTISFSPLPFSSLYLQVLPNFHPHCHFTNMSHRPWHRTAST